jgi:hypothetical protein
MWNFTKDTALSEQGRGAAWHVWINERHGRGTAWEWHGHGMLCVNRPLMFQMSRVAFCLLSACLLVILTCQCDCLNICSAAFCVGIEEKNCPGSYIESDPDNGICCSRCTVTKGEFCASRRLLTGECLSRCASVEIMLSKVSRRITFTKNLKEDRTLQSGCNRGRIGLKIWQQRVAINL